MAWAVEFDPAAARELKKLGPQASRRILVFLQERVAAATDPRSIGAALKGSQMGELWKYRVGDYRIICSIEDAVLQVLVVRVGHRREVYR